MTFREMIQRVSLRRRLQHSQPFTKMEDPSEVKMDQIPEEDQKREDPTDQAMMEQELFR
jgi:hypothetical protein